MFLTLASAISVSNKLNCIKFRVKGCDSMADNIKYALTCLKPWVQSNIKSKWINKTSLN